MDIRVFHHNLLFIFVFYVHCFDFSRNHVPISILIPTTVYRFDIHIKGTFMKCQTWWEPRLRCEKSLARTPETKIICEFTPLISSSTLSYSLILSFILSITSGCTLLFIIYNKISNSSSVLSTRESMSTMLNKSWLMMTARWSTILE